MTEETDYKELSEAAFSEAIDKMLDHLLEDVSIEDIVTKHIYKLRNLKEDLLWSWDIETTEEEYQEVTEAIAGVFASYEQQREELLNLSA